MFTSPKYIFLDKDLEVEDFNLVRLLENLKVKNKLKISARSISFLLQNGVIPLPFTIFENLYIEGFGYKLTEKKKVNFDYRFPFRIGGYNIPDKDDFINLVSSVIDKKIKNKKNIYLLHSAGKDSNIIALALKKIKNTNKIFLVNQNYSGNVQLNENQISKEIAKKLGFSHISIPDNLAIDLNKIRSFFLHMPFPCLDNVLLAYANFNQYIDMESNLIDGMGNDIYMGHISDNKEKFKQYIFSHLSFLKRIFNQETLSPLNLLVKTRSENTGLVGLSFKDSKLIFEKSSSTYKFWKLKDKKFANDNYELFRSKIRGTHIDNEMFIRKTRNFCDIYNHNLILPFYDQQVINYLISLNRKFLFNSRTRENKIFFRDIIKSELGIDYAKLGKMSFEYNYDNFIKCNKDLIINEIKKCEYFENFKELKNCFFNKIDNSKYKITGEYIKIRIFSLACWLNYSKFANNS